jgi:RNA polymerase sigma-70 factor, ECF subfamily
MHRARSYTREPTESVAAPQLVVDPHGQAERDLDGLIGPQRRTRQAMRESETDEDLMARVTQGDHAACRQLVERHLGPIYAVAYRTLGDRAAAEDVAQEVMTRLWAHAARWRPGPARLTTWLHRVALNLCFDQLARRRTQARHPAPEPIDTGRDAVTLVQERDVREHVRAALQSLPDTQRAAITLCHYEGISNAEAAEILGVSVEALESLLARARRNLRERLRAVAPQLLRGD